MCRIGRISDSRCQDFKMLKQQDKGHLIKDKGHLIKDKRQRTRDKRQETKDKRQKTRDKGLIKNLILSEFDAFGNLMKKRSLHILIS